MARIAYLLPLLVFAAIAAWMAVPLVRGDDPSVVPSALIDQPAPAFTLPALPGRDDGLSHTDLGGAPALVNVFASWCVPCLAEHPLITRMAEVDGITVHGIAYKDEPADSIAWLERHGDPYTRIGVDLDGRVGLDWGVYGVPETYVIDADGRIRYRHVGPMTPDTVDHTILPLLRELSG